MNEGINGYSELMIQTYGLHWHADKVFWGKKNNSGSLLGAASRSPNAIPIEFREQRGIYALYADYDLVYVGQTGSGDNRLLKRLNAHLNDHLAERWNRFSWFGTQWVTKQNKLSTDTAAIHEGIVSALNTLEAVSIAISEPRLNLQRGRWGEIQQYYQVNASEEFARN